MVFDLGRQITTLIKPILFNPLTERCFFVELKLDRNSNISVIFNLLR